ncbi:hypothetical protein NDU88_003379 [Pleurodeles waltl]|uniref:Uncharacterized protein n=1 Tax=Pleurodeles waltl TaxID=8319 RepID=A0AAV7T6E3_PLEWA|nr:hypothetical protein NDU88_003379 [Pleurodeles waltl]
MAPPSGTPNGVQERNVIRHSERAKQLISPAAKSTLSKTVGNLFDESEDCSLPQSQRTPSELAQRLTEPLRKETVTSVKMAQSFLEKSFGAEFAPPDVTRPPLDTTTRFPSHQGSATSRESAALKAWRFKQCRTSPGTKLKSLPHKEAR